MFSLEGKEGESKSTRGRSIDDLGEKGEGIWQQRLQIECEFEIREGRGANDP